ncbi:protein FAM207A isoform X2 [Haplochromis burtoni]|uniref:protein FAM207A isoform X2 n=1 Tax=Haplochromis burtoni TaxID=8153 RepID=UPI001C2D0482|nr:protein FAM207A isoform X2 [Haplochromis burtoni]
MVGKIKYVRQKLHHEAVKVDGPIGFAQHGSLVSSTVRKDPGELLTANLRLGSKPHRQAPALASFPSSVFAGTKISPEALVQTLKFDEAPDVPTPVTKAFENNREKATTGTEIKKMQSKKEKMKERRERWLSKISSIKQAKELQAAEVRRQATPVVGDMRPLADALPDLSQLISPASTAPVACRKSRKIKVETETSRFSKAVRTLSGKTNPLADIGELLRKKMRQEEEQSCV